MINQEDLNRLFDTMSSDMGISQFKGENITDYRKRLIYSGLAKWILCSFADREFEDTSSEISKSHVTTVAMDYLNSFKKIWPEIEEYIKNDKDVISEIQSVYLTLGYINSAAYNFLSSNFYQKIKICDESLTINSDYYIGRICGLGIYSSVEDKDISLDEFYTTKESSFTCFNNLLSFFKFEKFDSSCGKIEIYNINLNKWEFLTFNKAKEYRYSILRIDDGSAYKIIKTLDGDIYSASLPIIYSNGSDQLFKREIWRIILGVCAFNGKPVKAKIEKYYDCIKITLRGFALPFEEYAILKCLSWPYGNALSINNFVAESSMKNAIVSLLKHLSINIEGE